MGFAVVSIINPPWLAALSHPGAEAEALSYADRGDQCVRGGDFGRALWWYDRALKVDPDFVLARVNAAVANGQLGRFGEGIRLLQDASDRDVKQRGVILYNLAELYRRKGEAERAISIYEEALTAGGRPGLIHARLGEIYSAMGDAGRARDAFRDAVRAWGDPGTYYRDMLVTARATTGEDTTQVRAIEDALSRDITTADLARYDLDLIQQQIEHEPELARILGRLGLTEAQLGDSAAGAHLRRALEMWPANPQAEAIRSALAQLSVPEPRTGRRP